MGQITQQRGDFFSGEWSMNDVVNRVVYLERQFVVYFWWNVNNSLSVLRKLPMTDNFLAWIVSTTNKVSLG